MKRRILIVDDEFGLAELLSELLSEEGFDATIAINGQIGLDSLAENPPDLVILDVMMPIMGGPEMARAMKMNPSWASIPIIMMTALPSSLPQDTPSLYEASLQKPFSPAQLFAKIKLLLDSK